MIKIEGMGRLKGMVRFKISFEYHNVKPYEIMADT